MMIHKYESTEDEVKKTVGPVIFLAGPTVRGHQTHLTSWRPACVEEFKKQNFEGSLILPEFTVRTESDKNKDWIPKWEYVGLNRADCILFWIPRTKELIGLTTNWELGYWIGKQPEKVVYGRPDDAYRIRYLDIMWEVTHMNRKWEYTNQNNFLVPLIYNTIETVVKAAIDKAIERSK